MASISARVNIFKDWILWKPRRFKEGVMSFLHFSDTFKGQVPGEATRDRLEVGRMGAGERDGGEIQRRGAAARPSHGLNELA